MHLPCLGPSMLLVPGYSFLLYVWDVFSQFVQIHFQSPFLYLLLLGFLLCVHWHASYYPIGLLYCFHFFKIWLSVCCSDWLISIILSPRSFIHSYALFIQLFITFSSGFVSVSEFCNFSWLLLIVSSFLLQ